MPFPTREVPARNDIADVFQDNAQNILQKTNISNLIGLLQQLNTISKFASEIFTDILHDTDKNSQRIYDCRQRLQKIEKQCPASESLFIQNAPSYFYDNPYAGKEWQRRDPLRGLLFRRDRCTPAVNRRREQAQPPPIELNALNSISVQGPCLKKFTDSNFFMNEWLEAEKNKMKEAKKKRKARRMKKKKEKREKPKTIKAVARVKYDPRTGEKINVDHGDIAVKQYVFTDEQKQGAPKGSVAVPKAINRPAAGVKQHVQKSTVAKLADVQHKSAVEKEKQRQMKKAKEKVVLDAYNSSQAQIMEQARQQAQEKQMAQAHAAQHANMLAQQQRMPVAKGGGPPPLPAGAGPGGPPPFKPGQAGGPPAFKPGNGPPAVPPAFNGPVPGGAPPPFVPGGGGPGAGPGGPPSFVPNAEPKLSPYERAQLSRQAADDRNMYDAQAPAKPVNPQAKKAMHLFSDIRKGMKLKKTEQVKRAVPEDNRSKLMNALRSKAENRQLRVVKELDIRKKPVEEAPQGSIFEILNRRKYVADDSSDEDEDSSWGSESS